MRLLNQGFWKYVLPLSRSTSQRMALCSLFLCGLKMNYTNNVLLYSKRKKSFINFFPQIILCRATKWKLKPLTLNFEHLGTSHNFNSFIFKSWVTHWAVRTLKFGRCNNPPAPFWKVMQKTFLNYFDGKSFELYGFHFFKKKKAGVYGF